MAAPTAEDLPQPMRVIPVSRLKRSLKKAKKKNPLRNLLTKPHNDYWPVPTPEENARIEEAFRRLLDDEKNLDNMKLVEKELMALKRKKWSEFLVFGINDVPRCVVKGSISNVLIADDVSPKHLVQHVATLCGTVAIPILIVSSLRQYTKQLLGFSSIIIGLKKNVGESKDNRLYEIHKLIDEISKNYKPPLSIAQFKSAALKRKRSMYENTIPAKEVPAKTAEESTPSTDLYLYRTSHKSRVFMPESQKVESESLKVVKKERLEDFVSLGDSDWDLMETEAPVQGISYSMINRKKGPKQEHTTPPYEPLKYVKVKPNPNKKAR